MANIDIADPATDGPALTAALGSLLGYQKISSGAMSGHYIDISLPTGFDLFVLELINIKGSSTTDANYQTSSDGGISFHDGVTDYKNTVAIFSFLDADWTLTGESDFVGYFFGDVAVDTDPFGSSATLKIYPGSAGSYFTMSATQLAQWNDSTPDNWPSIAFFNSTVIAETARQNILRLYLGTPAGSLAFTTGSYILYGCS